MTKDETKLVGDFLYHHLTEHCDNQNRIDVVGLTAHAISKFNLPENEWDEVDQLVDKVIGFATGKWSPMQTAP